MFSLLGIIKNKTARNGALFSLFSFVNQGISFVLLVLLAKYIEPSDYGSLSLYYTVSTFVGFFVSLSTTGYYSVSYFKKEKLESRNDFSIIVLLTSFIFGLLILILLLFSYPLGAMLDLHPTLLYIAIINSLFQVFSNLNLDVNRIQEKVGYYGFLSMSFAILNFVLSLYLVVKTDLNWQGRVYAQLICYIIFGVFSLYSFWNKCLFDLSLFSWTRVKTIVLWGIPLIPHLAALWLRQGTDRYIINCFHGTTEVGLFSFALNITNVIISIGLAFNATNSVSIYQELSLNKSALEKKAKLKRQSKLIVLIYIFATAVIVIGITGFIPFFLPKYIDSLGYFYVLSIYGFIQCFYFLVCNYLFYFSKNKEIMYITFTTALCHLILSLIFTRYSLYYTCFIYVFVEILIVALVYWRSKVAIKKHLT